MTTFVRAAVLTNYLEVSQHLGLNPLELLAGVGLSKAQLQHPEHSVPLEATVRLLENSAAASGCQTFGLSMAESRQLSDLGVISLLLPHQRTLRDALQVLVDYRQLMNNSLALHIEEVGKTVIIREEVITQSPMPCHQANELAIGVLFRLCAAQLGAHWHPYSVHFTHVAPDNLQLHRRLFGCNLVFGSEFNGIVCPNANLDMANPHADPAMARYAQRYLDSLQSTAGPSILFEVRKAIYLRLPMGRASIEQIAQAQGLNVRTLQRRLKDEGYVFNALLSEARRDLVLRYIENLNYSLERISDMLGFTTATSLTRWFISQFGMSPSAWRSMKKNAPVRTAIATDTPLGRAEH
ncbi:AraC family transcriptional regulator [Pseudomonas sp. R5(2019)]|uniref:AraC family transcriptional regulator n=1 Tax=Pseudomonas sp. R5(2019) TaxID=2697566 RepID=UPI0014129680|nr:AraC family transcriptional regulator [Pseudomonas sp. R5(2019)]NBA96818.1 helix-turn-helix domain-containing protein [Pseudomonas sp. R5(2019)]